MEMHITELKTLNDITLDTFEDEQRLRNEAIKWIKLINTNQTKIKEFSEAKCPECLIKTMTWIKHFFNITEEELK